MKGVRCFLSVFALCVFALAANDAFAKPRKAKRKPGAVLKKSGYYCPIDSSDKVIVKPTVEAAIAAAAKKGYIPVEDHFRQFCEAPNSSPHTLMPSEILSFKFSFRFNGDETATSKLKLSKGVYRYTLECNTPVNTGVENDTQGLVVSIDPSIKKDSEITELDTPITTIFRIRDVARIGEDSFCANGTFTIERMS